MKFENEIDEAFRRFGRYPLHLRYYPNNEQPSRQWIATLGDQEIAAMGMASEPDFAIQTMQVGSWQNLPKILR